MADCAIMGVNWRQQTWWQYQALLSVHNRRNAPSDAPAAPANAERMRQVLDFHTLH